MLFIFCFLYLIGNSVEDSIRGVALYEFWGQLVWPFGFMIYIFLKKPAHIAVYGICSILAPFFMYLYSMMYHSIDNIPRLIFIVFVMSILGGIIKFGIRVAEIEDSKN